MNKAESLGLIVRELAAEHGLRVVDKLDDPTDPVVVLEGGWYKSKMRGGGEHHRLVRLTIELENGDALADAEEEALCKRTCEAKLRRMHGAPMT